MNKFDNKTTIQSEFGTMLSAAKSYFEAYNQKRYEFHKCLILCTSKGEHITYPLTSDSVDPLITQECTIVSDLKKSEKDVIKKIVCMWNGEAIDVPSYQFMKMLCEANVENKETEILLNAGPNAYTTKKIADNIG